MVDIGDMRDWGGRVTGDWTVDGVRERRGERAGAERCRVEKRVDGLPLGVGVAESVRRCSRGKGLQRVWWLGYGVREWRDGRLDGWTGGERQGREMRYPSSCSPSSASSLCFVEVLGPSFTACGINC